MDVFVGVEGRCAAGENIGFKSVEAALKLGSDLGREQLGTFEHVNVSA
jgi:hypothetical protein